jgi:hypothetical protein
MGLSTHTHAQDLTYVVWPKAGGPMDTLILTLLGLYIEFKLFLQNQRM